MASFGNQRTFVGITGANLNATQHHAVRFGSGAGAMDIASHAAATYALGAVGVQQTKADSGRAITVAYDGESKMVAGGSVTAGVIVTNNSSGRATAAVSGDIAIGRAMQAAGADGDLIRVLLFPPAVILRT